MWGEGVGEGAVLLPSHPTNFDFFLFQSSRFWMPFPTVYLPVLEAKTGDVGIKNLLLRACR